jgi:Predicted metal-dependent protease of the PAD1/JAB1 superfamily
VKIPVKFLEEAKLRCRPEVECPALLFGRGATVLTWKWVANVLQSPYAFRLDPEEMYRAITEAEEAGRELLAIFHTHPGPPAPSPLDLRHMRLWPVVWVISDVYSWDVAAWKLQRGKAVPVRIEWI